MPETARIEIDPENIATITLDLPNKPVNTLCLAMLRDLKQLFDVDLKVEPKALLLTSAKPKIFIAGADIGEIQSLSRDELMKYLELGDEVFSRIAAMKCPTVAVINGTTLGGGLEIAMSCRYRVCGDVPSIKLGLPETTIGLVPGWAGTVRLPKLVGFEKAIAMLTDGKPVSPKEALELGLVDRVVAMDQLMNAAHQIVNEKPARREVEKPSKDQILSMLSQAESNIKKKTRDWFPAPLKILDLTKIGLEKGEQAQMKAEREALCDLRDGEVGSNLLRNFFMRTGAKKSAASAFKAEPLAVNSCAVIGGGTMGAGIAHAMLKSGLPVVLIEQNAELASSAQSRVNQMLDDDVAGNRMPANVASEAKSKFTSTHDFSKLSDADVIVEAVFEDINVKRDTFAKIAQHAKPSAVLASNTSSLSIDDIAKTTKSPAKIGGLHFFNPVPRMALVEVVRGNSTDDQTGATLVALAHKLNKTAVVCRDAPGFIVNRILFPYLASAIKLAQGGVPIQSIDKAMQNWGWPMGPFVLMDTIGLDVCGMIFGVLKSPLGDRVTWPDVCARAVTEKRLGRKSGRGFYIYPPKDQKGAEPAVDSDFARVLSSKSIEMSESEIQSKLMRAMTDESKRVMDEKVCGDAEAIDLASQLGLGFPVFRGGPMALSSGTK